MVAQTLAAIIEQAAAPKEPMKAPSNGVCLGATLEVIGGTGKGGIIVRVDAGRDAAEAEARLATGSLVRVAELKGERVSYQLLSGSGPQAGWVSLSHSGKLLLRAAEQNEGRENEEICSGLKWYCEQFEDKRTANDSHVFSRKAFYFGLHGDKIIAEPEALKAEIVSEVEGVQKEQEREQKRKEERADAIARSTFNKQRTCADYEEDSDGEMVRICPGCNLAMGSRTFAMDGKFNDVRHMECMAQVALLQMQKKEQDLKDEEIQVKAERREEFEIGWSTDVIPDTAAAAKKLGFDAKPGSMVCLTFNMEDSTVHLAPTCEPASAMNLEYLSLALQVRRTEGREPLFSLDPLDKQDAERAEDSTMQQKKFIPEWLAGTSVGDVMFQADYLLKELSMGEYDQPVVGMRSCLDYQEQDRSDKEWAGREWFVVRDAAITMSEDDVLIPVLKMGVEAREQVRGPMGLEDAPMTRPDHPLVKYANAFTHNFDLIAERRSVIFQLREVAKASAMAKFMLESGMQFGEEWFNLSAPAKNICCLEVPMLWSHRVAATLKMEDNNLVHAVGDKRKNNSVYGGVDFGIDRFRMSAPGKMASSLMATRASMMASRTAGIRPSAPSISTTVTGMTQAGLSAGLLASTRAGMVRSGPISSLSAPTRLSAPFAPSVAASRPASALMATSRIAGPSRISMGATPSARFSSMVTPQGVDLDMDRFNLSTAEKSGVWSSKVVAGNNQGALVGDAFWSNLSSKQSLFSQESKALLNAVFEKGLSDRRDEGVNFVPPPTNCAEKLRHLIDAEASLRKQRSEFFFSTSFSAERNIGAGLLFPSTWTPSVEFENKAPEQEVLKLRPDLKSQEKVLKEFLVDAVPTFDRTTEDGIRWLVYRFGALEIRATETPGGKLEVGAVFSVASNTSSDRVLGGRRVKDSEMISKVELCVEKAAYGKLRSQHFLVATTEAGNRVMVEKRGDGLMSWVENPKNADDRISLAKVVESKAQCKTGITVGDLREMHRTEEASVHRAAGTSSRSKRYGNALYEFAAGGTTTSGRPGGVLPSADDFLASGSL